MALHHLLFLPSVLLTFTEPIRVLKVQHMHLSFDSQANAMAEQAVSRRQGIRVPEVDYPALADFDHRNTSPSG